MKVKEGIMLKKRLFLRWLDGGSTKTPEHRSEGDTLEIYRRLDGVRVMLVDDNPDILDVHKSIFMESGAEVVTAASAKDALKAFNCERPDVLVSDIVMPDQDGYQLIRQVRRRPADRGGTTPAVALTAHVKAEDHVCALASGFQVYLAKPVDPDVLIAVVASLTKGIEPDQSERCA
jgi:CheY-like chemotaxis protein